MTINENFVDEKSGLRSASAVRDVYSFTEVVDNACDKLKDRQIKYSIRRIQVMEDRLSDMERELDIFLSGRN